MTAGEDLNETLHKGGIYNKVNKCCKLIDIVKVNCNTNQKVFLAHPKDKGGKSFFFPRWKLIYGFSRVKRRLLDFFLKIKDSKCYKRGLLISFLALLLTSKLIKAVTKRYSESATTLEISYWKMNFTLFLKLACYTETIKV